MVGGAFASRQVRLVCANVHIGPGWSTAGYPPLVGTDYVHVRLRRVSLLMASTLSEVLGYVAAATPAGCTRPASLA